MFDTNGRGTGKNRNTVEEEHYEFNIGKKMIHVHSLNLELYGNQRYTISQFQNSLFLIHNMKDKPPYGISYKDSIST